MSELTEKLRYAAESDTIVDCWPGLATDLREAATEIECLWAELVTTKDTLGRSVALHTEFDAEIERLRIACEAAENSKRDEWLRRKMAEARLAAAETALRACINLIEDSAEHEGYERGVTDVQLTPDGYRLSNARAVLAGKGET